MELKMSYLKYFDILRENNGGEIIKNLISSRSPQESQ